MPRMKKACLVVSIGIASLASSACDKGSGAPPSSSATPAASPPATTAPAAAAAAPNLTLSGTCTTKAGARMLGCTEYYGKLPDGVEASCKKDDGTFASGATPCSADSAVGKCAHAATATAKQVEVSYKTSVGDPKGSCEVLGNTWTALGSGK
jgi:hypothetical protein